MRKIIVAPYQAERFLLSKLRKEDPFLDVKFYTREELLENLRYSYGDDAVVYLIKRRGFGYSLARSILECLVYVDHYEGDDPKISELKALKDELLKEGLLVRNEYLDYELGRGEIEVYCYPEEDEVLRGIIGRYHPVYHKPDRPVSRLVVDHFKNAEDEIVYVLNEMAGLLKQGVSANRIFLYGPPRQYELSLSRAASDFGINIEGLVRKSLNSSAPARYFLSNYFLKEEDELLTELEGLYKDNDPDYYDAVRRIIDSYKIDGLDKTRQYHIYRDVFLSRDAPRKRYVEAVRILEEPVVNEGDYLFIMCFAENNFPVAYKDEGYLSDDEKEKTGMPTSRTENLARNRLFAGCLRQNASIHLSYSDALNENEYRPNYFVKELGLKVVDEPEIKTVYSRKEAALKLADEMDLRRNYRAERKEYYRYAEALKIRYMAYDPKYGKVEHFGDFDLLSLSYSGLELYDTCKYYYYLNNVLKVDEKIRTFSLSLGSLAHAIFQRIGEKDFDALFAEELAKWPDPSPKDRALLRRLREELRISYDFTIAQEKAVRNALIRRELPIEIVLDGRTRVVGRLDKLIEAGDAREQVAIIDYKIGGEAFKEKLVQFGLSMQLPLYFLLVRSDPRYKDKRLLGVYIARLIPSGALFDKSDLKNVLSDRKLNGVSLNDAVALGSLEPKLVKYGEIGFIAHLRTKADGTLRKCHQAKDGEWFDQMADEARKRLVSMGEGLRANDFSIDPKRFRQDFYSCRYCPYQDVCHRSEKMIEDLSPVGEGSEEGEEPGDEVD